MALYLLNFIGIIIFLFLFWKRIKEDYISTQIFTTSFGILLCILIGSIVSHMFAPSWWFWLEFLGVVTGLFLGIFRFRIRFFEVGEALVLSLLPWLSTIFLYDSVKNRNIYSYISFIFIIFMISLFYFLDARYKKFSWYRSGRVGFSGGVVLCVFFLTRMIVALFIPTVLSFQGTYEAYLSGLVAISAGVVVFRLSRKLQ